ncbi:MAG: hypothetical protein K0M40_00355 [Prolixibacteraceae bacterium]|nr:hypothetical protein [Prolixibacteraceae bacterium]
MKNKSIQPISSTRDIRFLKNLCAMVFFPDFASKALDQFLVTIEISIKTDPIDTQRLSVGTDTYPKIARIPVALISNCVKPLRKKKEGHY